MKKDDASTSKARSARDERLKMALRENLKRRKEQARGRAGMTIVTPEDAGAKHIDKSGRS